MPLALVPLLPVVPLPPVEPDVGEGEADSAVCEETLPAERGPSTPEEVTTFPGGFCPAGKLALGVIARVWKAVKFLAAVGLIAKTIPD